MGVPPPPFGVDMRPCRPARRQPTHYGRSRSDSTIDIAHDKQSLRQLLRERRAGFVAALPPAAHMFAFRAPPPPLMRAAEGLTTIALYLPVGDEAPAARFATHLRAAGKTL